jgi:putative membrane protein insertion efficiency factor
MLRALAAVGRIPGSLLIVCVRFYQRGISPLLGSNCRFQPTCSEYMIGSIRKHGAFFGLFRGIWRILRCHPMCRGGYDPP